MNAARHRSLVLLLGGFVDLGFVAGEIEFNQNELILHSGFELVVLKHLLFELDAPATPIRTSEVDEQVLALFSSPGLGGIKIGCPALAAGVELGDESEHDARLEE